MAYHGFCPAVGKAAPAQPVERVKAALKVHVTGCNAVPALKRAVKRHKIKPAALLCEILHGVLREQPCVVRPEQPPAPLGILYEVYGRLYICGVVRAQRGNPVPEQTKGLKVPDNMYPYLHLVGADSLAGGKGLLARFLNLLYLFCRALGDIDIQRYVGALRPAEEVLVQEVVEVAVGYQNMMVFPHIQPAM